MLARGGLALGQYELTPEQRAGRVEAYRLQVALAGSIVEWLPPPATVRRVRHEDRPFRYGRQRRWFDYGRLEGPCRLRG